MSSARYLYERQLQADRARERQNESCQHILRQHTQGQIQANHERNVDYRRRHQAVSQRQKEQERLDDIRRKEAEREAMMERKAIREAAEAQAEREASRKLAEDRKRQRIISESTELRDLER
ncbi:hypothetical protein KIPB_009232, partial [Kipferlia bialata]|eukprot:g9232.t1